MNNLIMSVQIILRKSMAKDNWSVWQKVFSYNGIISSAICMKFRQNLTKTPERCDQDTQPLMRYIFDMLYIQQNNWQAHGQRPSREYS